MELRFGLEVLAESAKRLNSGMDVVSVIADLLYLGNFEDDAFQASFSAIHDDLGQWRGYADDGLGCSVVCPRSDLDSVGDVSGFVMYMPNDQHSFAESVLQSLHSVKTEAELRRVLVAASCFMKHPGFASEREYRIIAFPDSQLVDFRESRGRLVPYCDLLSPMNRCLNLVRVIVGPGWQLAGLPTNQYVKHHVVLSIRRLAELRGIANLPIEPSSIPYDPR